MIRAALKTEMSEQVSINTTGRRNVILALYAMDTWGSFL
jgi:hypothetical protein